MTCYVDTSALTKRYLKETGSEAFDSFVSNALFDLVICPLVTTEFSALIQRRLRMGHINAQQADHVRQRFMADIISGGWKMIDFDPTAFGKASDLFAGVALPLATLDALHLASALLHGATVFATADRQLAAVARKLKFSVPTFDE